EGAAGDAAAGGDDRVPRRVPTARPRSHPAVGRPSHLTRRAGHAHAATGGRVGGEQVTAALLAQVSQTPTRLGPLQVPKVQYSAILPELALVVGALMLLMVWSLVRARSRVGVNTAVTILTAAVSLCGS